MNTERPCFILKHQIHLDVQLHVSHISDFKEKKMEITLLGSKFHMK